MCPLTLGRISFRRATTFVLNISYQVEALNCCVRLGFGPDPLAKLVKVLFCKRFISPLLPHAPNFDHCFPHSVNFLGCLLFLLLIESCQDRLLVAVVVRLAWLE